MKKLNFGRRFHTYDENALVQKKVAEKLSLYIDKKLYNRVLELGVGTGIFTREMLKKTDVSQLTLNDYFDTKKYFKEIAYDRFIEEDMSKITFDEYDLICSSSSFQWLDDLEAFFKKISEHTSELIFSIYIEGNLKEIKNYFGIHLNYHTFDELQDIIKKYFEIEMAEEEELILKFDTPLDVLRHMKNTGVTGLGRASIAEIKKFKETKLTYKIAYFKCRRKRDVGTKE